jgi:hypothetical protein
VDQYSGGSNNFCGTEYDGYRDFHGALWTDTGTVHFVDHATYAVTFTQEVVGASTVLVAFAEAADAFTARPQPTAPHKGYMCGNEGNPSFSYYATLSGFTESLFGPELYGVQSACTAGAEVVWFVERGECAVTLRVEAPRYLGAIDWDFTYR